MSTTLEHRIADAFENPEAFSSKDLAELLGEVKVAADEAGRAKAEADRVAMNPATRPEAVREARSASEDASFQAARFTAAVEGLADLVREAESREEDQAARDEYQAAKAERDKLAEDLKAYPELARQIVDLLDRLKRNDERIAKANKNKFDDEWLKSAETLARQLPANWTAHGSMSGARTLTQCRIVAFEPRPDPNSFGQIWPPPSRY